MTVSDDDLAAALTFDEFPRAAGYDPRWMLEYLMGPMWFRSRVLGRGFCRHTRPDGGGGHPLYRTGAARGRNGLEPIRRAGWERIRDYGSQVKTAGQQYRPSGMFERNVTTALDAYS